MNTPIERQYNLFLVSIAVAIVVAQGEWVLRSIHIKRKRKFTLMFVGIFTSRNEVVAKVIFLHLSVILFTGGDMSEADTPSGSDTP